VGEGVLEPGEHTRSVLVVVVTTMVVVLLVTMGVLGILMSVHRRSLSLAKPAGMTSAPCAAGPGIVVHWYSKTAATL
jgi:hypothetical protein